LHSILKIPEMKTNFSILILAFCLFFMAACTKDEGEGGTSTIKGTLFEKVYDNSYRTVLSQSYSPDEKVFIIYGGDHETYDDDYNTSYNGTYEFKYLQKGTYKIFAYTTDTTGVSVTGYVDENKPKIPMFATVDITENNSTVTAPNLTILKNNAKGSSTIRGKIFLKLYDGSFQLLLASYYIPDEDVFIISNGTNETYFADTKTSYNGEYYFDELPAGDYRVFAYSTDTTGVAQTGSVNENLPKIPVFVNVTIGNNADVTAPDITILDY
jgi:hypothetical protein